MDKSDQELRLFGVYRQDKNDNFMLRVKIPAGVLNCEQAERICSLSDRFSNSVLHLTSRGSIEFHWLRQEHLEDVFDGLADVGLTTRGACGGAVRGISCSTVLSSAFAEVQRVAQQLNRHFAGNPDFEGLPKKFKVSVDAGYEGARHLIQDLGLVMVDKAADGPVFDVWCAGGLGREPQPAFLLDKEVPEKKLVLLIEAVVEVYRNNTPPPKRLKFLLNKIGENEFRRLLKEEIAQHSTPVAVKLDPDVPLVSHGNFVELPVFAGELDTAMFRVLAEIARQKGNGLLAVTTDQNIALLVDAGNADALEQHLRQQSLLAEDSSGIARFRVCPGNHECRMGLSATRDIAARIMQEVPASLRTMSWAISGCRNSCSQPQLADFGIVTNKLNNAEDGTRRPMFDLYRRKDDGLGKSVASGLSLDELCGSIRSLK